MSLADTETYWSCLQAAAAHVKAALGEADIGIVLGSGLSNFDEILENKKTISFSDVPNMPVPHVAGHSGKLSVGTLGSNQILCFAGRVHAYENYHGFQLAFQARLAALVGCKLLIVTNAAGGYIEGIKPGDAMIMRDHVNFHFSCPIGDTSGDERFGTVSQLHPQQFYSTRIGEIAKQVAKEIDMNLHSGVYTWNPGPAYESLAEVNSLLDCCVHAFGMSTVPEVFAARAMGMEVFAMSVVTNLAAGKGDGILQHEEVQEVAKAASGKLRALLVGVLSRVDTVPLAKPLAAAGSNVRIKPPFPSLSVSDVKGYGSILNAALQSKHIDTLLVTSSAVWPQLAVTFPADIAAVSLPHDIFVGAKAEPVTFKIGHWDSDWVCVLDLPLRDYMSDRVALTLAAIISSAGIKKMITLVDARNAHDGESAVRTSVITDIVSNTCGFGLWSGGSSKHNAISTLSLSSLPATSVMQFPGPNLPTPAERDIAVKAAKVDTIAVTTMGLALAAASLSMVTATVAFSQSSTDWDVVHGVVKQVLAVKDEPSSVAADPSSYWDLPRVPQASVHSLQHAPAEGTPVTYQKCKQVAAEISKQIPSSFASGYPAVFLDSRIPLTSDIFESSTHFDVSELIKDDISEGSDYRISFGTWKATSSAVCTLHRASRPQSHIITHKHGRDLTFAIRVLKLLGVSKFLAMVPVSACDAVDGGAVFLAKDHINMVGSSPLFGHNEEEFGARFPDMSTPYDPALTAAALASPEKPTEACILLLGNCKASPAEKRMATSFGCQAITDQGVHAVITTAHLKLPTALIGIQSPSHQQDIHQWATKGFALLSHLIKNQ